MRFVITFAAAALVAAAIIPKYAAHLIDTRTPSEMAAAQPVAIEAAVPSSDSVVVEPDASGHFRVQGDVDGRALSFMIDTGASVIALTAADAASLGIHPAVNDYTVVLTTANGTVHAAPTRLDRVEIGDLEVSDVAAVVMPEGALSDDLLGLSFLSRLRHFEFSGGRMVLEQ
jgi:aspartyl protease family protein